jgi:hypothetical protein
MSAFDLTEGIRINHPMNGNDKFSM